jgi:pilus assembly protein CpaB
MNKYRSLLALLVSTLLGLGTIGLLSRWMQQQIASSTQDVVVAAQDIPIGTRLQASMLKTVRWPGSTPLRDAIPSVEDCVGRVVHVSLFQDEPLIQAKLAPAGEKGGLSAQLGDGQRAVTVKVNEVMGVAGFALPGNYVDVMVNATDGLNQPISKIVLERIQVLAVAQDVATPEGKPKVVNAVTLEVTPAQAETIDIARSIGSVSLVLRNQRDPAGLLTTGVRKDDLWRTGLSSSPASTRLEGASRLPRTPRLSASGPATPAPATVSSAAPVIRGLTVSAQ